MAHGTTIKFVGGDHLHVDQAIEDVLKLAEHGGALALTTGGNAREVFVNWANVTFARAAD